MSSDTFIRERPLNILNDNMASTQSAIEQRLRDLSNHLAIAEGQGGEANKIAWENIHRIMGELATLVYLTDDPVSRHLEQPLRLRGILLTRRLLSRYP